MPTIEVAFSLTADGEGCVARIRLSADRHPIATFNLPRAAVDKAVLDAGQARLEVRLDGTVAAYLDVNSRSLTSARLSELVAAALTEEMLAAEGESAAIDRLEAELERALDLVRRVRR